MRIGIVDPYSTGAQLCERLSARGVKLTHIDSGLEVPSTMRETFSRDCFDEFVSGRDLIGACGVTTTLEHFDWIVAGSESGVFVANSLASQTRRPMFAGSPPSKYEVVAILTEAGLRAPRTEILTDVSTIDSVIVNFSFPVVVKPLWSATGDGVRLCNDLEEVIAACADALLRPNIYGVSIDAVLMQEFLPGEEYYCNLVSSEGEHVAIEVWRYAKRRMPDGGWVYASEDYVPLTGEHGRIVAEYCVEVLRAIDFRNGATHLEVMVHDNEAALVEANYRLGGATAPDVIDEVAGSSQVKAFVELLTTEVDYVARLGDDVLPKQAMRNVFLYPRRGGLMRDGIGFAFRAVKSTRAVELHISSNGRDDESTLLASPGFVFLAADSHAQLALAERDVRLLEESADV